VDALCLQDLGTAGLTKRPTSCMLILPKPPKGDVPEEEASKFKEDYDELLVEAKSIAVVF
jgi:H/ACA ribonucleoprotein complex subunit 2